MKDAIGYLLTFLTCAVFAYLPFLAIWNNRMYRIGIGLCDSNRLAEVDEFLKDYESTWGHLLNPVHLVRSYRRWNAQVSKHA